MERGERAAHDGEQRSLLQNTAAFEARHLSCACAALSDAEERNRQERDARSWAAMMARDRAQMSSCANQ